MAYIRKSMERLLKGNSYPGRGLVIGKSSDGRRAFFAYFIMGRSENSRNRIFTEHDGNIKTEPFDAAKVTDPSLIIYTPVKTLDRDIVITNGDQTDTIEEFIVKGKTFHDALLTRTFEPDEPNYTPRISGIIHLAKKSFTYEMAILKSADGKGKKCNRYFFEYEPVNGVGHYLHTYEKDGNPLPSYMGEPDRVKIGNDLKEFADEIWNNLNKDNKISLYCRAVNLRTWQEEEVLYNRNQK